jgi:hypothetical protein
MRLIVVCAAAVCLSGCSSAVSYIVDNYAGTSPVTVVTNDDNYRVFDHPRENKLMITSGLGRAISAGSIKGATFGAVSGIAPKPFFEEAGTKFLRETGRANCRITDGYMLIDPQMEFKFECRDKQGKVASGKEPGIPYQAAERDLEIVAQRDSGAHADRGGPK